jgi:hypothetical protein
MVNDVAASAPTDVHVHLQTIHHSLHGVRRGPHHHFKLPRSPGFFLVKVVVDDVAHLLPAPVHKPVVPVERLFAPHLVSRPRQRAQVMWPTRDVGAKLDIRFYQLTFFEPQGAPMASIDQPPQPCQAGAIAS